jgi:hypothetical protein
MANIFQSLLRAEARRSELEAGGADPEGGEALGEPGEIRWEGAVFERVTSIERQLAGLEESLGKRVPEVEQRLLHLLEGRLAGLEADLHQAMSGLASELALEADRRRNEQRRILWALAAVGILVLLF